MKKYARSFVISLLAFLAVAYFYPGFSFNNNLMVLALAALVFAALTIFVKPVIKLLSLPFNLLTFGLFSFLINVIILYGVSFLITDFKIVSYHFSGFSFSGFNLPAADISQFFSAIIASFIVGFISTILHWVFH